MPVEPVTESREELNNTAIFPIDKLHKDKVIAIIISAHEHLIKFKKRKHQTFYYRTKAPLVIEQFIRACQPEPSSLEQPMDWLCSPNFDINFIFESNDVINIGVLAPDAINIPKVGYVKLSDSPTLMALLKDCLNHREDNPKDMLNMFK